MISEAYLLSGPSRKIPALISVMFAAMQYGR
jgi:hypothetical protein